MNRDYSASRDPANRRASPLLAMLAVNALWGAGLGLLFVAGVLALDIGHLRKLLTLSADGAIALALLSVGSMVTFASVVTGGAVMMLGKSRDSGPRSGKRELAALTPALSRVPARRSRRQG